MLATWDLNRVWYGMVIHPMRILTKWLGKSRKRIDDNPPNEAYNIMFWPMVSHFVKAFLDIHHVWDFPIWNHLFWWSIAMFDYRSGYQPSLRLGLPNDRRDAIGLHGSLEQGVQSMAGRNSAWKHRSYAVVVSMYPHLVVPRRFLVQSSWIPMSVNSPISVGQIMSNLSSYACSFSATMFSKKVPKLTLLATSCGCKTVLSPTLVRPSPDTPTNLIYLKVLGMARCWLVVYLPLWKKMEFVSWDDDYSQLNGKIKSKCSKPPTSNYHILSSSWWPYLGE